MLTLKNKPKVFTVLGFVFAGLGLVCIVLSHFNLANNHVTNIFTSMMMISLGFRILYTPPRNENYKPKYGIILIAVGALVAIDTIVMMIVKLH